MTKEAFLRAMENVAVSIQKHGDVECLCEIIDPNGGLTEDGAVRLFKEESTSDETYRFLEEQEITTSAPGESFESWDYGPECYYIVGSDIREGTDDGTMSYLFEDLYCISTRGNLFKLCTLNVAGIIMDYEYTLLLSVEPYSRRTKWQARLDILCEAKDSPLHKYLEYFQQ